MDTPKTKQFIQASLSGAVWYLQGSVYSMPETQRRAEGLAAARAMPAALAWYLACNGIDGEGMDGFLSPRLRDSLPDPHIMQDAKKAIDLICNAIESKQPVGIFGDYDVDGACAAAVFRAVLPRFGCPVYCHIPDRFSEGYGPNITALQGLKAQGAELILTVDCGITAHQPLQAAADAEMKILVIDHHKAGPVLPRAEAVVNPNRLDDDSGLGHLCAAGVCFLILAGVMRECRQRGLVPTDGVMPDLLSLLDMVALATICDIVPLKGVNRAFVKQGLKVLAQRQNTGLRALMDVARLDQMPTTHTLGFLLGPRINAGGRLGRSDLGVQLLTSYDDGVAESLALELDELNMQRRITEKQVELQAKEMALQKLAKNPELTVLVLAAEGWHEGVIGIVAGRIKDRFNRPALVIALDKHGLGKGSGRSVRGFSLGDAIMAARQRGLLETGGGHDMAAGLGVRAEKLSEFEEFILARAGDVFAGPPQKSYLACHSVSVAGLDYDFTQWLEKIGPFGSGFAEPRIYITHCQLKNHHWMGSEKQHLSVSLDDGTAAPLRAVAFNLAGTPLGKVLQDTPDPGLVMVLGTLRPDSFRGGKNIQFMIEDIALHP